MVNFRNIVGTFLTSAVLFSCSDKQTNPKTPEQETPKALQENTISEIKSYGRGGNLIEELYQELVDKTPALQKLEGDLSDYQKKPSVLTDKFNEYDHKSSEYYGLANYNANTISDSLLRKKMVAFIAASGQKYKNNTAQLDELLKQISKNNNKLSDHHSVLKLVLTLPIIEKYQADHKPDKKEFEGLIKQQEQLLMRTDSLTPKY